MHDRRVFVIEQQQGRVARRALEAIVGTDPFVARGVSRKRASYIG